MNDQERLDAARALLEAEDTGTPIEPMSATYPDADVQDAYRVAMLVADLKIERGQVIKGHKIGLTSKPMQELAGAAEPDFGYLFAEWFVDEGSTIPMSQCNRPLVEVELAFVLGEALQGPYVTTADVIRATDFILPALEIVDSRYTGYGPKMLIDSISDAASCGRIVVGARPLDLKEIDIRAIGAALMKNGVVEVSGMSSEVVGSPVNAVAWLANKLGEFGVAMEPGHVVLSGSFTKAIRFEAGDTITATFTEFGEVGFRAS